MPYFDSPASLSGNFFRIYTEIAMKRKLVIAAIVIVTLCAAIVAYSRMNAQFPKLAANGECDPVAVFPMTDGNILVADSVMMKVDTGSVVSLLTEKDAECLRKAGAKVSEEWFPSMAVDVNDKVFFATRRYRVDLPVMEHALVADSRGEVRYVATGKPLGEITGMLFLPAPEGQESVVGTDVLERFFVEVRYDHGALALHSEMPAGYQKLCKLVSPTYLYSMMGCGDRYYVNIETESVPNQYFIDSGIDKVHLKLPAADTVTVKSRLQRGVYHSSRGEIDAHYCNAGWVKVGNRAGTHRIYFATDGTEDYALNPLEFFEQDLVLDFANHNLYLRPTTKFASNRF